MTDGATSYTVCRVGIAEAVVVHKPIRIKTTGLGSCVGVVLYDLNAGVAGLAHIMLPRAPSEERVNTYKYADLAVPWLIRELLAHGASIGNLEAKVAGGAQMFVTESKSEILRIGPRNVQAIHEVLDLAKIPIAGEDTGGTVGRTIEFDCNTGILWIRTAKAGIYYV